MYGVAIKTPDFQSYDPGFNCLPDCALENGLRVAIDLLSSKEHIHGYRI